MGWTARGKMKSFVHTWPRGTGLCYAVILFVRVAPIVMGLPGYLCFFFLLAQCLAGYTTCWLVSTANAAAAAAAGGLDDDVLWSILGYFTAKRYTHTKYSKAFMGI